MPPNYKRGCNNMTKQEQIKNLIEYLNNDKTLHDANMRLHFAIGYMGTNKDIRELLEAIAGKEDK